MNPSLPTHLSGHEALGLVPGEPIAQFEIGELKNFVYLLIDWKSRECAIIDPQKDLTPLREAMSKEQLKPVAVLLTHTHPDHIAGLGELVSLFPDLSVYVHERDLHRIRETTRSMAKLRFLKDGQKLQVGSIPIEVLHTPGHSPGECCYFIAGLASSAPLIGTESPSASARQMARPYLFTGDTIFIRDCGRTDFAGGSTVEMFDSIQSIKQLPDASVILCGHHYRPEVASTLGVERVDSPPFRARTVAELEALP